MKRSAASCNHPLLLACAWVLLVGSATGQTITEFPIPTAASFPIAITDGRDGNLWFAENEAGNVGRISTTGVVTEVPVQAYVGGITAGPDGNLWLTTYGKAQIVRVTPSGSTTSFPFGDPVCSPTFCPVLGAIAQGPDGNLWFVFSSLMGAGGLGRITTDGVFLDFATQPAYSSPPTELTRGPDGALWFTETIANKIGRITTTGSLTEFPIPTADGGPRGIARGPDGNLWFTQSNFQKIGRITPTGTITDFPSGTGLPNGIALGPDGNLWFTANAPTEVAAGLGLIGSISPAGVVEESPLPTPYANPVAITAGPDGDMWFTEVGSNKIGRITTVGPAAFHTLAPCRAVDTRDPEGPLGGPPLAANTARTFILAGRCGIPSDATAVAANLTAIGSSAAGDLRVHPGGTALPLVSAVNYASGQTRANDAVVRLGHSGGLAVHCDQASGVVHLVVDVNGYFK
jgi:streptogramin lyase